MVSDDEWMDSSALTDDMIKATWSKKSPARKEADKAIRQSLAKFQGLMSASAVPDSGRKTVNEQGQAEHKKSKFSMNFLRASLLSPKASSAAKADSMFRKSAPDNPQASTRHSESPTHTAQRVDSDTTAGQSYSPLGQGAAAFTPTSPGLLPMERQLKPLRLSIANSTRDAWSEDANTESGGDTPARSPLQTLSSNSPTRRSLSTLNRSIDLQASLNKALPLLSRTLPSSNPDNAQRHTFSPKQCIESQALKLARQPQHQHSPLPPNALVAYSSDDDDEDHNTGADATASLDLGLNRVSNPPAEVDDSASVHSYHSDASTDEVTGDLYQVDELVPSALMLTPSASLEDDDAQYDPTMTPSAFQAALAAGILAAHHQPTAADAVATQLAKPVHLVLTPLRDARIEVSLTCTDEPALRQPGFTEHQDPPDAMPSAQAEPAKVAAGSGLEPALSAVGQQSADTLVDTPSAIAAQLSESSAAVVPAPGSASVLAHSSEQEQASSGISSVCPQQDAQALLEHVADESPQTAASEIADPHADAADQPASASPAAPAVPAQQSDTPPEPHELSQQVHAVQQAHTASVVVNNIALPHCSKRQAEGQLDCQPFFKAPRVPPAETPGIPKPHVDTVADPASPVPRHQSAHLDDVVNSFVNNIISAVKLELTASAMTNNAGAATIAAAELAGTNAPNAEQRVQEPDAADVQPISAVSSSQPAAATLCNSIPIPAVDTQQQPAAQVQGMHVLSTDPSAAAEPGTGAVEAESVVQELLHGMLDMVASDETSVEADMAPAHSLALSHGLSSEFSRVLSQPCPITIATAPAVIDLAAASAPLAQPHAPASSTRSLPPAVAAQHAHILDDSVSQPVPSPNYRMDHVLADSLHDAMHHTHDFGPMSLVSAMSNDENITPAASRDFSRAAAAPTTEASEPSAEENVAAELPQAGTERQHRQNRHLNAPRPPFWETQMTPHGRHAAPHPALPPTEQAADTTVLPVVTPATEVNALGQPLSLQQSVASRPAVAALHAEVITPPGGYQPQQVWENNIFSPEIVAERPRSAAAMGALRRLSDSPLMSHSQSAAPAIRSYGPAHLAGLRIQVPVDPLLPEAQSASSAPDSQPASSMSTTTAISIAHQQPSVPLLAAVFATDAEVQSSQLRREVPIASTSGRPNADVQQQTASSGSGHSPEFDASFAGEAETMFIAGQGASGASQLQRRLRLSDIGIDSQHQASAADAAATQRLEQEAAQLQELNADLVQDKQEALLLLDAYRLSISQLQERHSLDAVQAKTAAAVLQAQITKLEKEKDVVEQQFNQLYHEKYYPLKESHKAAVATTQQLQEQQHQSQEQVEKLRTQLATADLKLRKSGLEAQGLAQQLQQSQGNLEAQKSLLADKDAGLEAAQAAVQRLQRQLDSSASSNTSLKEAQAESESLRQQVEESNRKYSTVKQARERAMSEVYAKEEEVCELQVKLQERDSALKAYKTENGRFADMKDKFKSDIASLQQQVLEKEQETAQLLNMCNEAVNKLEKAGISL